MPTTKTSASAPEHSSAFTRFIEWFSVWSIRWIPDAMVFVLILSLVVFCMAWGLTTHGPAQLVKDWVGGFWALLTFAMQMCVLMITGFCVADSKPVRRAITAFVTMFDSPKKAIICYTLLVCFIWWLHWGVGMMVSIIMGRELCARNKGLGLHYPLVAAVAYCALASGSGPSQAAPLLLATPGHFLEKLTGVIPITETALNPQLLLINLLIYIAIPILFVNMMPSPSKVEEISDDLAKEFTADIPDIPMANRSPAQILDHSFLLPGLVCLLGLYWIGDFLVTQGIRKLDLNTLNFIFVIIGLLLHKNPHNFMASVGRGVTMVGAVIIQFPFYAGIFGMIKSSGLSDIIAGWFVSISTTHTFPLINFIYSGVMNIFVPSGGSKFIIEAPYIVPAAQKLGTYIPYVINSYTMGDMCTNLIQPFWALPILGAFRLRFQQILPYGFMMMIVTAIIMMFGIYFFPFIFGTPPVTPVG